MMHCKITWEQLINYAMALVGLSVQWNNQLAFTVRILQTGLSSEILGNYSFLVYKCLPILQIRDSAWTVSVSFSGALSAAAMAAASSSSSSQSRISLSAPVYNLVYGSAWLLFLLRSFCLSFLSAAIPGTHTASACFLMCSHGWVYGHTVKHLCYLVYRRDPSRSCPLPRWVPCLLQEPLFTCS